MRRADSATRRGKRGKDRGEANLRLGMSVRIRPLCFEVFAQCSLLFPQLNIGREQFNYSVLQFYNWEAFRKTVRTVSQTHPLHRIETPKFKNCKKKS